ncbi:DSS1 Exoribonuclease II [Candida maltosa Xu316]
MTWFRKGIIKNLLKKKPTKASKVLGEFEFSKLKIDLNERNKDLVNEIKNRAQKLFKQMYLEPGKKWHVPKDDVDYWKTGDNFTNLPKEELVSGSKINQPVAIGDLVTLGTDSLRLYIVADDPKSFDSRVCTFVSDRGEVIFASSTTIGYRFPMPFEDKDIRFFQSLVSMEKKILGVAPVGVPDAKFSRSDSSLPKELRKEESNTENNDSGEGEEREFDPSNFIVQQAASKYLIDSNVKTFVVPLTARKMYRESLVDISNKAFMKLGAMHRKLLKLHKELQRDENGELNAPRTISIFEILYRLKEKGHQPAETVSNLGKNVDNVIDYNAVQYPISTVLALLYTLRNQSRFWTLMPARASYNPTHATIWPTAQILHEDKVVHYLNKQNGIEEIVDYCVKKITGKTNDSSPPPPVMYTSVLDMLREYTNEMYQDNAAISTTLVSLLRKIEKKLIEVGAPLAEESYRSEYSYGKAFDLLTKLNHGAIFNPTAYSRQTGVEKEDFAITDFMQQSFYDFMDKEYENGSDEVMNTTLKNELYETDPFENLRHDMRDIPVYCIDDASAHEIDDAISIHKEDSNYVISVHIAQPTSFIKPDSVISRIGFAKASTTYTPGTVFPMFPQLVSKLAGLGIKDKDTRTFVIQFKIKQDTLDSFIKQKLENPNSELDSTLLKDIHDNWIVETGEIKYANVRDFRQGFTYDKVNEVLADKEKIEQYKNHGATNNGDFDNLIKLQHMSHILRAIREENDAYINSVSNGKLGVKECDNNTSEFVRDGDKVQVKLPDSNKAISVSSASMDDASTMLVSEHMICANYLTTTFAKKNNIPILYRDLEVKFNEDLIQEYRDLLVKTKKNEVGIDRFFQLFTFFTSSSIRDKSAKHFLLGLESYTNITSPLRRYIDMVNQWKFQSHFLKTNTIPEESLPGIANYLNAQNEVVKRIQSKSSSFWEGLFLKVYRDLVNAGKIDKPIDFQMRLLTSPKRGTTVGVHVPNLRYIRTHVNVSPALLKEIQDGGLKVGGLLDSNKLHLKQVDFVENEVIFDYK